MTIDKAGYLLYVGTYGFTDAALSYVTILSVNREGAGYEIVRGNNQDPGNREALYDETTGTITFRDPGVRVSGGLSLLAEVVQVIYKY